MSEDQENEEPSSQDEAIQKSAIQVYINYEQLTAILNELRARIQLTISSQYGSHKAAAIPYAKAFNSILQKTRVAFEFDEQFLNSIKDIEEVEEKEDASIMEHVLSWGSKLRATLRAFIHLYMQPEHKKQIGFVLSED